jgi:sugar diacid utilization regulator
MGRSQRSSQAVVATKQSKGASPRPPEPGARAPRDATPAEITASIRPRDKGAANDPASGATDQAGELLALRDLVTIYRQLTTIAIEARDISAISDLLATKFGTVVCVVTATLDVISASSPTGSGTDGSSYFKEHSTTVQLRRVLEAATHARRAVRSPTTELNGSMLIAPIVVGTDVLAFLVMIEDTGDLEEDIKLLVAEHAAAMSGIILGRERVVASAAGRIRDDLFEGLLHRRSNDSRELDRWAQHLGYDPSRSHRVLSISTNIRRDSGSPQDDGTAERSDRVLSIMEYFCRSRLSAAITAVRDTELVVLAEESEPHSSFDLNRVISECIAYSEQLFPDATVVVGIGGAVSRPTDISQGYLQARRAADAARRLGRFGEILAFDDLGVARLLLQVRDSADLESFTAEVLGELLEGSRRTFREPLVETLAAYFHENGSPQRTAKRLHVHPNTVTYRLKRIEDISGLDLHNYRHRLMAQVALEALQLLDNPHG